MENKIMHESDPDSWKNLDSNEKLEQLRLGIDMIVGNVNKITEILVEKEILKWIDK